MTIGKRWAGRAYGTNTGNLYVTLEGSDDALLGTLRLLDTALGITIYSVSGRFDGSNLELTGEPQNSSDALPLTTLTAKGVLSSSGIFNGEWETEAGTAG